MNYCTVVVPREKSRYTLFAEGVLLNVASTDTESYVTLDGDYCVVLYYTVGKYRRLYVCCGGKALADDARYLSGCNVPLSVLCELSGRAYDRFKRSLAYLVRATDEACYRFPASFFWQLAVLCQLGKNARLNLALLVHRYDAGIVIPKRMGRKAGGK